MIKYKIPQAHLVNQLRERFPKGTRVELISIADPYNTKLKPGDQGIVDFVDDVGTVFVDWDCGSSLGLIYGHDKFRVV